MRRTKAYVIHLRNLLKAGGLLTLLVLLAYGMLFQGALELAMEQVVLFTLKTEHILSAVPVLNVLESPAKPNANTGRLLDILFNENLENPNRILSGNLPFLRGIKEKLSETYSFVNESNFYYMPKILEKKPPELPPRTDLNPTLETTSKSIKANGTPLEKKGLLIKNDTTYGVNGEALYQNTKIPAKTPSKPQVLIVHTHGSEAFNPTDRNHDTTINIVRVGAEMTQVLQENGIEVIHSPIMHDVPLYNSSYKRSLETIQKIVKENPTINVVLDVHRDAMITAKGEVYKVVAEADGVKAAQVMFVVGTNQGGLTHDGWQENLKLAMLFQEEINRMHPNLARPINLRKERFNQHVTPGSMIVEVGTNGNTIEEAILGGREAAKAIANVLNR